MRNKSKIQVFKTNNDYKKSIGTYKEEKNENSWTFDFNMYGTSSTSVSTYSFTGGTIRYIA